MGAKKDFLSDLASQVEAKKRGERDRISTIDDYKPREIRNVPEDDLNEYPEVDEFISPARKPEPKEAPAGKKAEAPVQKKPEPVREPEPVYDDSNAYSSDGKADSFNEEQFVRYEKPKRTISTAGIAALAAALALCAFLVWWFFIAAHITMPDFVGKNINDVSSWARQNEISSTAIAQSQPEYSLEYNEGTVIRQSVEPGKKIKKDTPITITVSAGADPDENISFPDLKSMTLSEVREWISANKLAKTKITTQYSETVPDGEIISYEVRNASESDFTRGTTLNIVASKGKAPAGQITVQDFKNKSYTEVESWANGKKISLVKQEVYSDTVASGFVISQSAASGSSLSEGGTFTVVVSKGKGIRIPNLVGYTREQLEAWRAANAIQVVTKSVYDPAPDGSVISQSIAPNTTVGSQDVLELTVSLYLPTLDTATNSWIGRDYLELLAWVDEVNNKGGRIQAGQYGNYQYSLCSDQYPKKGQIVAYACEYGTSDYDNGCARPLTLDARIAYTISEGACTTRQFILNQSDMATLDSIKAWCIANGITYSIEPNPDLADGKIEMETTKAGTIHQTDEFPIVIPEGTVVNIHWGNTPDPQPTPAPAPQQIVLNQTDLASLETIQAFCESHSITYEIDPAGTGYEGDTTSKVIILIGDSKTPVKESDPNQFPLVISSDTSLKIYYNKQ
ncbi:MAG: PASTA domain-containing protein [Erysipelotrichaceae bacterium]|nr:PASTA domain-containing protein [Erysipelotrichaceae bacterium]